MEAPQKPLRPTKIYKGKKKPNMFKGPKPEAPPGKKVRFQEDTVRLPIYGDGINPLIDDQGFLDKQIDYDFLYEQGMMMDLPFLRKVVPELPTKVYPNFDVKFDKAKHGAYLKEHLKNDPMSPRQISRLTAAIKYNWLIFNPDGVKHTVIGYECDIDTGDARPISCGNVNY